MINNENIIDSRVDDSDTYEVGKIVKYSRFFEEELHVLYGAEGKGLHTKIESVEEKLDPEIVKKIRFVATIRNKAVHEQNFNLCQINFLPTCNEIERYFNEIRRIREEEAKKNQKWSVWKFIKRIFGKSK